MNNKTQAQNKQMSDTRNPRRTTSQNNSSHGSFFNCCSTKPDNSHDTDMDARSRPPHTNFEKKELLQIKENYSKLQNLYKTLQFEKQQTSNDMQELQQTNDNLRNKIQNLKSEHQHQSVQSLSLKTALDIELKILRDTNERMQNYSPVIVDEEKANQSELKSDEILVKELREVNRKLKNDMQEKQEVHQIQRSRFMQEIQDMKKEQLQLQFLQSEKIHNLERSKKALETELTEMRDEQQQNIRTLHKSVSKITMDDSKTMDEEKDFELQNTAKFEDENDHQMIVKYISDMDENQLYLCWDKTAHDLNGNNNLPVKVFTGKFFPNLMANIIEYASKTSTKIQAIDISLIITQLTSIIRRGYSNEERTKKELFNFHASNEITRLEFGLHFISLMVDPECTMDSSYTAPSFTPTILEDNTMIDEIAARIAMAIHSKKNAGMKIGSILLNFNSQQRSNIIGAYNLTLSQTENENIFIKNIQHLKNVSKPCKTLLALLQYSREELDNYWLTEACKAGKINVIFEILATRTSTQLMQHKNVQKAIISKYGKDKKFLYMVNKLLNGSREQSLYVSDRECFNDAQMIYKCLYSNAVQIKSLKKNISAYEEIYDFLCDRSLAHIRCTSEHYLSISSNDLATDLIQFLHKEKFKNAAEFASLIMEVSMDIIRFFTRMLALSMEGLGMNIFDFNRVVLSRCEIDLAAINYCFSTEFGSGLTLLSWILNEKGTNFPVYRAFILQLFGIGNKVPAILYELRHYSLTVWNPCLFGVMSAEFNAKHQVMRVNELIDACAKENVNYKQLNQLCVFLCDMSLEQRCMMNNASQNIFSHFEKLVIVDKSKKDAEKWENVGNILRGFFEPLPNFDAFCINVLLKKREFAKIGFILACRSDDEIRAIIHVYEVMFSQNLLQYLVARCKSSNKKTCRDIFENLLQCKRSGENPSIVDYSAVHLDCVSLINPPKNRSRKMEIVRVLCTRTWKHIRCVNDHYNRMSAERNLERLVISSSNSGESIQVLMCLLKYSLNPVTYFADSLVSFGNGSGDCWLDVGRLIISRAEIDMKGIDVRYSLRHKSKCSLGLWIEKECSDCPPLMKCMLIALLQSRDKQRNLKYQIGK